jgi:hypothetical protein
MRSLTVGLALLTALAGGAPHLTPGELTPFLRVISASLGTPGRVACRDIDLSMQFKKDGLSPDARAPVAFAASAEQIKTYLADGKFVVCGEEAGLKLGASIAVFKDKGKPIMVVNRKNAAATGLTLSDALLKIARIQ